MMDDTATRSYPVGAQVTVGDDPTVWTISQGGGDGLVWLHRVEERQDETGRTASVNIMAVVRIADAGPQIDPPDQIA